MTVKNAIVKTIFDEDGISVADFSAEVDERWPKESGVSRWIADVIWIFDISDDDVCEGLNSLIGKLDARFRIGIASDIANCDGDRFCVDLAVDDDVGGGDSAGD